MKIHLSFGKKKALCGQYSKRPLRTTNVSKMEECLKCRRIRSKRAA